jgi:septal ring factor EnvC (AmiA/AmiB activator)
MSVGSRPIFVERGPVSLGCGTLIFIALIVLIFSGRPENDNATIRTELQKLQNQVSTLRSSIEDQTRQISRLEQQVKKFENDRRQQAENPIPVKD